MACKTETKEIGSHEYSVTQWPVEKAMLIKFKLAKTFGAPIAVLMGASNKMGEKEESELVAKGLAAMFSSNNPEDLVSLIKSCIIGVAVDGKRLTETSFQEHFETDNLAEVYRVFIFVLQVNFSNLFKGQLADRFLARVQDKL